MLQSTFDTIQKYLSIATDGVENKFFTKTICFLFNLFGKWKLPVTVGLAKHLCGVATGETYYACNAWCDSRSGGALLVDRASLRHKRDNKLRGIYSYYALRCITATGVLHKTRGIVLATCCHHRCEHKGFIANKHLQELGINGDELNVMLGIVSWATCGDGRSRDTRKQLDKDAKHDAANQNHDSNEQNNEATNQYHDISRKNNDSTNSNDESLPKEQIDRLTLPQEYRELVGRRAKHLIDWARVLYLRDKGLDARLCYFVPTSVSLENVCIVAKKLT